MSGNATENATECPAGWFGKVPMLGDFAHRRLPGAVVTSCDLWLSASLAQSRVTLGAAWLDTYLSAPLWCFGLAPRVFDSSWWLGVVMPSVDAVGRYFPLIVMREAPVLPATPDALSALSGWYRAAADGALSTLQPRATLEMFEAELAAITWPMGGTKRQLATRIEGGEFTIPIDNSHEWFREAPTIAIQTVLAELEGRSLWWPLVSQPQAAEVSIVRGLPGPERFARMLQGRW